MKIHSDTLTAGDIVNATLARGMKGVQAEYTTHGSRSRQRAFNVKLTGTSTRRPNGGTRGAVTDEYAATWDEWGMFINALFEVDPEAIIGQYKSRDVFEMFTADRFEGLTAPYQHKNHKWEFVAPRQFACDCGASQDYREN